MHSPTAPTAPASQRRHRRIRWTLIVLLSLISVNALAAGFSFIQQPDGTGLGIPQDWLLGTPFRDYRIPGILLFGLGLLHAFAAFTEVRRRPSAWFWAGMSAGGILIWIVVQAFLMGSTRHPMQTILQAAVLVVGIATGLLALAQFRRRGWGVGGRAGGSDADG